MKYCRGQWKRFDVHKQKQAAVLSSLPKMIIIDLVIMIMRMLMVAMTIIIMATVLRIRKVIAIIKKIIYIFFKMTTMT